MWRNDDDDDDDKLIGVFRCIARFVMPKSHPVPSIPSHSFHPGGLASSSFSLVLALFPRAQYEPDGGERERRVVDMAKEGLEGIFTRTCGDFRSRDPQKMKIRRERMGNANVVNYGVLLRSDSEIIYGVNLGIKLLKLHADRPAFPPSREKGGKHRHRSKMSDELSRFALRPTCRAELSSPNLATNCRIPRESGSQPVNCT